MTQSIMLYIVKGEKTLDNLRMKTELHINFKTENNILLKRISTMYAIHFPITL